MSSAEKFPCRIMGLGKAIITSTLDIMSTSKTNETHSPVLAWKKTRMTISILSLVLGLYVYQQADQVTTLGRLAAAFSGKEVGSTGMLLSLCLLVAGGMGIFTHIKQWKPGILISGILCSLGALLSLDVGIYQDLYVWNTLAFIFSAVFLIGFFRKSKDASA